MRSLGAGCARARARAESGLHGEKTELVVDEGLPGPARERKAKPWLRLQPHLTREVCQVIPGREAQVRLVAGVAALLWAHEEHLASRPQVGQVLAEQRDCLLL